MDVLHTVETLLDEMESLGADNDEVQVLRGYYFLLSDEPGSVKISTQLFLEVLDVKPVRKLISFLYLPKSLKITELLYTILIACSMDFPYLFVAKGLQTCFTWACKCVQI